MSTHNGLQPASAEVADGVFHVPATETNSILVTEGKAVTVVDVGYPKDLARVEASLARIGRRVPDVSAVVVTHAHMDHIGDSARWRRGRPATARPPRPSCLPHRTSGHPARFPRALFLAARARLRPGAPRACP